MVLIGNHKTFTQDKRGYFKQLFRKCVKSALALPIGIKTAQSFSPIYSAEKKVVIDGQEYFLCDVEHALYNTGFITIEQFIDNQMINHNGGLK